jgi:hypothetical protein
MDEDARSGGAGVAFWFSARAICFSQASGVRGWREGCRSDWRAHCHRCCLGRRGGAAVSVTGAPGVSGHKTLLSLVHRAAEGPTELRHGRRACDKAAGSPVPRVPAPAGYGNGAALQITALVSGAGSILHDHTRTKRNSSWRGRIGWVAGAALSALLAGSAQRRGRGLQGSVPDWRLGEKPKGPARSTDGQR